MTNLALVFVTGVTAGGLSCLAVQGGMLASSLAPEDTVSPSDAKHQVAGKRQPSAAHQAPARYQPARPIALFLGAKLVAYTLLGAALGWVGSLLQLTPMMRAVLQIAIGLFMIVTALRLLNVHPVFRHFVIQPPRFITRYIRRRTKQAPAEGQPAQPGKPRPGPLRAGRLQPVFLGTLTVLIPCGVTQGMMALAVASGNPAAGALIMFAFVLGTTPLFFALAYLATKLGAKAQKQFWKVAGAVVLALGLVAVDSGLTLAGSPFSLAALRQAVAQNIHESGARNAKADDLPAAVASANNELTMTITTRAYTPAVMEAKAGLPIKLTVKTDNARGCGRSLVIPSLNIQKLLGENDSQVFELPPTVAGSIRLTCVMGMYGSVINVK